MAASTAPAYLDDDGFTARVMAALPAPAALPAWRKPALTVLWAVAGSASRWRCRARSPTSPTRSCALILGQPVSLAGIAAGVVALGAATWAAAALALRDD